MNPKSSTLGSIWRKWDLHFHTPASYDYAYKGATNKEIVDGLIKAGVEVVAITDHHRIDTKRIVELQNPVVVGIRYVDPAVLVSGVR